MRSGEISVLTGRPGSGKTTFATFIAYQMQRCNDIRIGFCSFETRPSELRRHLMRLNGCLGYPNKCDPEKESRVLDALRDQYRVVHRRDFDESDGPRVHGIHWLKGIVHKLAAHEGCSIIIVDPWNELEHIPEDSETMTQYINWALGEMRRWAEKYDIHILVVAHPKKMQRKVMPEGYDIADSAAFFNKPGMGWTISNEDDEERGEHTALLIWKVRDREDTGAVPGEILRLRYNVTRMDYEKLRKRGTINDSGLSDQE